MANFTACLIRKHNINYDVGHKKKINIFMAGGKLAAVGQPNLSG